MRDIHAGWRDRDVAIRPATGFYVVHRVHSSGLRTPGARSRWLSRRPVGPHPTGRERNRVQIGAVLKIVLGIMLMAEERALKGAR